MSGPFDLIVIGAGTAGCAAARRALQLGMRTALVEKDGVLGGTHFLPGFLPSENQHQAAEDWLAILRKVRDVGPSLERSLDTQDVTVIRGLGRLEGPGQVKVEQDQGTTHLTAARIILATGSTAAGLPGVDIDGQRILTSDQILDLEALPDRIVVVGGGSLGVELATLLQACGCRVTLVEMKDQVLPLEDAEVAAEVARSLERSGMSLRTRHRAIGLETAGQGVQVTLKNLDDDRLNILKADGLLLAVGRKPATRDLGLETVQVVQDRKGFIQTDSVMATATPGLYAVGDIVPSPRLAPLARHEARTAVGHAAGLPVPPLSYQAVPRCVYGRPETASVGIHEEAALAAGHLVRSGRFPFRALDIPGSDGGTPGFIKVIIDAESDQILGVHMVGPRVTELIGEACTVLQAGITATRWAQTIHPHPSLGEALGEAVRAALGQTHGGA